MKTNPRWTCRVVRRWQAVFGRGDANRGLGSNHIAGCADCQRYFAADQELTRALHHDAPLLRQSVPAGFDREVLAAITASAPKPARAHSFRPMVLAFGGLAAAVLLVLIPLRERSSSRIAPPMETFTGKIPAPTTLDPLPALQASVSAVLEREPLGREVDSVYADARSAVDFLALNFLPEGTASVRTAPHPQGT